MIYTYTALDPANRRTRGQREAESEHHVLAALQAENLRDIRIRAAWWATPILDRAVNRRDVALFTRLFGALISTTGTPAAALRVLQTDLPSRSLRRVVGDLSVQVQGGLSVADTMRRHPRVFPADYVNVIAAGEKTGRLPQVLTQLASRLGRDEDRRAKSRSAAVYPISVLLIAFGLGWYMLKNVVPPFARILLDSGMELSLSTRLMISTSTALNEHGNLVLAGLAGAVWLGFRLMKDPRVQDAVGVLLVRVPVLGPLIEANAMASFCGILGLALGSGVNVVEALAIAADTIPNRRIARAVTRAVPEVAEGGSIAASLERTGALPLLVPHVVAVGEKSGTLPQQLEQTALFYDGEIDHLSRRLSSASEVGLTTLVALGIAVLVVSLYLPLFQATRYIGR